MLNNSVSVNLLSLLSHPSLHLCLHSSASVHLLSHSLSSLHLSTTTLFLSVARFTLDVQGWAVGALLAVCIKHMKKEGGIVVDGRCCLQAGSGGYYITEL